MIPTFLIFNNFALLILRLVVGTTYLIQGVLKLENSKKTTKQFEHIGCKPGKFWGTFFAIFEILGGFLMVVGFFVQLLGVAFVLYLVLISVKTMRKQKKSKRVEGLGYNVLLLAALLMLIASGGGAFSLDIYFPIILY